MFKNPLKYQQGGQLNEQQQQMLAAFIDWLPKRVKEFQGMKPEAIVQALDGMSKTPEGQKQIQQLMEQFQQESQSGQSFKRGGKIQDFICKHAKGGVAGCGCVKKAQDGTNVPQYQVTRDTTYMNPANQRIMEQVIVGPDGQAYRRTTVNGTNPIAIGGYWDGEFIPEGDDIIPVQRFESLFRRAIPKQKPQSNQKIVKDQNPAGPMPDPSYFGTISQGKPRSKVSQAIDNNSKARNFVKGVKQFVNSPMVRLPLAGAAAYGGWKLSGIPIIQETGEIAPKIAPYLFPFLSQLRPKFVVDTINPMTTPEKSWHNTFWAMPEDNIMDKIDK